MNLITSNDTYESGVYYTLLRKLILNNYVTMSLSKDSITYFSPYYLCYGRSLCYISRDLEICRVLARE